MGIRNGTFAMFLYPKAPWPAMILSWSGPLCPSTSCPTSFMLILRVFRFCLFGGCKSQNSVHTYFATWCLTLKWCQNKLTSFYVKTNLTEWVFVSILKVIEQSKRDSLTVQGELIFEPKSLFFSNLWFSTASWDLSKDRRTFYIEKINVPRSSSHLMRNFSLILITPNIARILII